MTIGVISEGNTDHLVIRTIIDTLINHEQEDKALISKLCPMADEPSGYPKVLSYIQNETFKDNFNATDYYTVIHLDSDAKLDWAGEFKGREDVLEILRQIPSVSGGEKGKEIEILVEIEKFIRHIIGPEFYDKYKERIILAIAVSEMECWVLPFHAITKSDKEKIVNCLNTLNKLLSPKGYTISPNTKAAGDLKYYRKAIEDMAKRRILLDKHQHNESLKIFIERILTIA